MKLKFLVEEDFINYKKGSMFIGFPQCSFKCEKECGVTCCQNSSLAMQPSIEISIEKIIQRYSNNNISEALVCGGLEPFDSWDDLKALIKQFREITEDDIVIYTGYNKEEIQDKLSYLKQFKNIIIKFGRFIPNQVAHYDKILGVKLASDNQYAEKIT